MYAYSHKKTKNHGFKQSKRAHCSLIFKFFFSYPRSACIITKVMDFMDPVPLKHPAPNCIFASTFCVASAGSEATANDPMTY